MTDKHRTSRAGRGGFTLVELLIVIAIITILAGLLLTATGLVRDRSRAKAARQLIHRIQAAIDEYNEIFGTGWMDTATFEVPTAEDVGITRAQYADITFDGDELAIPQAVFDSLLLANQGITETILLQSDAVSFTASKEPGARAEIYEDPDTGDRYVVDPWFNPRDPQRDLDNHLILFMREGFNSGGIDIWCMGANGQLQRIKPSEDSPERPARHNIGDDVYNSDE